MHTTFPSLLSSPGTSYSLFGGTDIGLPEISQETAAGIAVAIAGNILISLALNFQKLAHRRIDRYRGTKTHPPTIATRRITDTSPENSGPIATYRKRQERKVTCISLRGTLRRLFWRLSLCSITTCISRRTTVLLHNRETRHRPTRNGNHDLLRSNPPLPVPSVLTLGQLVLCSQWTYFQSDGVILRMEKRQTDMIASHKTMILTKVTI